jgi:hypothetical protein
MRGPDDPGLGPKSDRVHLSPRRTAVLFQNGNRRNSFRKTKFYSK